VRQLYHQFKINIYSKTVTNNTTPISKDTSFGPCTGHYQTYTLFGTCDKNDTFVQCMIFQISK